jgi:small GTP-binding protein
MGGKHSSLQKKNLPIRLLLLGLDSAGKTTLLYHMIRKDEKTEPTLGFNVETATIKGQDYTIWDVSGQDKLRPYWRHYYRGSSGIIFLVDSADQGRINLAKQEITRVLSEDELQHVVILVLANKQDMPNCLNAQEVESALNMQNIAGSRPYKVFPANCIKQDGLDAAFAWLKDAIDANEKAIFDKLQSDLKKADAKKQ